MATCDLYLQIVEILVQTLKLPVPTVLHLALDDEPENIVGEAVTGDRGFDRGKLLLHVAVLCDGLSN
jgi:hypothetical protein